MKITQGIDIVSVPRMKLAAERQGPRFLDRIFTPEERRYCESKRMKYEHYAARFAAKEAAMKAFEIRRQNRFRFRDIEIRRRPTGKPEIFLTPAARKRFGLPARCKMEMSMAHEREYAVATVLLFVPGKNTHP